MTVKKIGRMRPGNGCSAWACIFLGTPYAAGTLDNEGPETLVINLRQFDCLPLRKVSSL